MKKTYKEISKSEKIVIWGAGKYLNDYGDKLDPDLKIVGICDSNEKKWGQFYTDKKIECVSKDLLDGTMSVIIAIKEESEVRLVSKELDNKGLSYCLLSEAVEGYCIRQEEILAEKFFSMYPTEVKEETVIKKYILCNVPYNDCNLRCPYCYIGQTIGYTKLKLIKHSPKYIRAALSQKRLGGAAIITLCGRGETLLDASVPDIIKELTEEGHFVTIVTNGTITSAFDKILNLPIDKKTLFFKFSLHYMELKRLNLLDVYAQNVRKVWTQGCSITLELVSSDDLVDYIDEIKEWSMKNFGAWPHLTIARDDRQKTFTLLTEMSINEFEKTWKCFDSKMFDFKIETLNMKRFKNCMAGDWSFVVSLDTGKINKCTGNPYISNIYEDIFSDIYLEKVGDKCCLPYCYNCHAYMALGISNEIEAPTYFEVRDRVTDKGEHWVNDTVRNVFTQKLYINNN